MSLKKIKLAMDEETVEKEGLPPTAGKRGIVKENMLIILGHLLSLVPSEVQSRELPPLLPLLFEALSSTEDGLVDSALITLTQLQSNQSDEIIKSLETHLETIIEKFIKIVYSKLSLRVRCCALQNLRGLTRLQNVESKCVRNREMVLRELKNSLNDTKRVIRKEASLTMNIWSMVGQE